MRFRITRFGVGALLAGALACSAQERATVEPGRFDSASAAAEDPRAARVTTAGPKPAVRWKHDRRRPTLMTPLAAQLRTRQWSEAASRLDALREQFRMEKTANSFHREVKLHLMGLGPVQIAAFEARQPAATLCGPDCTGEGAWRLVHRVRPTRRSYGLALALRWN
ncbi:MAG: hypothetical protein K6U02_07905 [Firmicutes bacterium]|nr:hypothetical protein [Bacillota bacterium]